LVRVALSHYYPLPPPAWRFVTGKYGKPSVDLAIAPDCRLHFNLSNAVGLVVCLIADSVEVGVDVESFARADQILQVAREVFSAEEQAQLDAMPQPGKLDRGMALWTLKEAYIKARGMGLSLPLAKISFLFGGSEGIRLKTDPVVDDNPERWRFCLLDHAGHRIAVMVESAQPRALEVLEARPVLAPPVPANVSRAQWFPLEYPSSSEEFPPRSSL
jgi:4'-phosphopantetheinyl transferase